MTLRSRARGDIGVRVESKIVKLAKLDRSESCKSTTRVSIFRHLDVVLEIRIH